MSDVSDQRRYYERMMDEIATEHRHQTDQLEAENAKLRELVGDMWRTIDHNNACDVDRYGEPLQCICCEQYGHVNEFCKGAHVIGCKLMYRMAALGIEVD